MLGWGGVHQLSVACQGLSGMEMRKEDGQDKKNEEGRRALGFVRIPQAVQFLERRAGFVHLHGIGCSMSSQLHVAFVALYKRCWLSTD